MAAPQHTDNRLLALIARGDRHAFAVLYRRYLNNLYRYVYSICYNKEEAEEIVQELFVKLWENRASLEQVISFKAYAFRAAKNLLLNHIRKARTESSAIDQLQQAPTAYTENLAEGKLFYSEHYRMAQHAIELLPDKRKQIFRMRLTDELSLDEIAEKLSISKSVVKKQLYLGIAFVRKYLLDHGQIVILFIINRYLGR
ncbi:RNA polymerase sigma-70 factor (ECF subfamily) [Mucilaginibacter sp. SG538B]|uniref:RNA polymerase sigma factor n=1 Tax=Mucilaginibacter sp. SG538B TaxID=2587021 RepID=UPI00159DE006|nr:RNA polymerase sigma-70 factor [Mucilaginibacter sp. SG538B]NVM67290.1 RNA polymerase sigma-70 factor (ECF subfamily) [Mucilaginibacter sp. SG538B]